MLAYYNCVKSESPTVEPGTMKSISLKLDPALERRLTETARRRGVTKSSVVRAALLSFLESGTSPGGLSAYDLAKDLCGSVAGPGDLSYNKAHMEGFGK